MFFGLRIIFDTSDFSLQTIYYIQGSYGVWKSMEFDFSIFQVWKSMEKRKQSMEKFPDFCPYLVFFFFYRKLKVSSPKNEN